MFKGYFTPAGQSETVGVAPVFVFNGIAASATVDEGNNWINMTYGPVDLEPSAGSNRFRLYRVRRAHRGERRSGCRARRVFDYGQFGRGRRGLCSGAGNTQPRTSTGSRGRRARVHRCGGVGIPAAHVDDDYTEFQGYKERPSRSPLTGTNFTPGSNVTISGNWDQSIRGHFQRNLDHDQFRDCGQRDQSALER